MNFEQRAKYKNGDLIKKTLIFKVKETSVKREDMND